MYAPSCESGRAESQRRVESPTISQRRYTVPTRTYALTIIELYIKENNQLGILLHLDICCVILWLRRHWTASGDPVQLDDARDEVASKYCDAS